ncbi:MAG: glycosyltransferase family 39 protein [Candidatus Omnitrophica bacterium]|nr:glycosyltransferase family 39 protein [Candidatus Omnitrophota bacterium]
MTKKTLFFIVFAFFLIRVFLIIFSINYPVIPQDYRDFNQYNNYALSILNNYSWLYSPNFQGDFREPLYPLFLAFIYLLFGKQNLFAIFIFQAIISTATAYIIYKLALRIFGKTAAVVSLFLAGLNGYYLFYVFNPLRETLNYFLVILFFYLLFICLNDSRHKKKYLFLASLSLVLLVHTDSRYLYFFPCCAALFLIFNHFKTGLKNFIIFSSIAIVLSVPWMVRNYVAYNNFVLISTFHFKPGVNLVNNFKLKIKPKSLSTVYYVACPGKNQKELKLCPRFTNIYWLSLRKFLSPFQFDVLYNTDGKVIFKHSLLGNICSILSYGLLLPFALIGLINLRKQMKFLFFILLPLLLHSLIHIFIAGEYRYRIPMDSFLIILAGGGIAVLYCRIKHPTVS